jgi:hypothetical protein
MTRVKLWEGGGKRGPNCRGKQDERKRSTRLHPAVQLREEEEREPEREREREREGEKRGSTRLASCNLRAICKMQEVCKSDG